MAVGKWDSNVQYLIDKEDSSLLNVIDESVLAQLLAIGGDVSDFNNATDSLEAISDAIAAISAGTGTPNAFLAAVGGALDDAAASGAVTDVDTAMAYIKQLVTAIQLIPTTMRGTDSAYLASVAATANEFAAHIQRHGGEIFYVNKDGDDANDGSTPHLAKLTIQDAIDSAAAGDAISIKAGTYAENVDMDEVGLELWPEIGTVIAPASGTPLTVSANFCKVWCPGGSLKVMPAANETGVAVTGQFCYLSDIRVTCASTADIGFYVGSAADNTEGDGCVFDNCRCSSPLIAAFKLQADKLKLGGCCTGGESGNSSIGFWALPDASGVMDKLRLKDCGSQGHETAGYQIDSGCTNGAIEASYSGGGDGRWVDNGTNFTWPHFSFDDEVVNLVTLSVAGGGGTEAYNLFKVTGAVKVVGIHADVQTALTGTNTDCFLELYSTNGSVAISKDDDGKTLGALAKGSIIIRLDKEDKVLVVADVGSGPAIIDQTDVKEEGFRVVQDRTGGSGVDTYIRFVHTCADTGTGVLDWHCKWEPVDGDGFLEVA